MVHPHLSIGKMKRFEAISNGEYIYIYISLKSFPLKLMCVCIYIYVYETESLICIQPFFLIYVKVRQCCSSTICTVCSDIRAEVPSATVYFICIFFEGGLLHQSNCPAGICPPELNEIHKSHLKQQQQQFIQ